jgi:large subunit ribosomal protein L1
VEFRVDKTGIVHTTIGKASFTPEQLKENLTALMEAIVRGKPAGAKGIFVRSVYLAPTMGPSVPVDPVLASRLTAAA